MSNACGDVLGQVHAESKLEGLEDQLRRLKAQCDELARQNQDLNSWKARLTQENYEMQRQVQELDSSNGALAKAKAALQQQLDEAKARLDEESRVSHVVLVFMDTQHPQLWGAELARAANEWDKMNN